MYYLRISSKILTKNEYPVIKYTRIVNNFHYKYLKKKKKNAFYNLFK